MRAPFGVWILLLALLAPGCCGDDDDDVAGDGDADADADGDGDGDGDGDSDGDGDADCGICPPEAGSCDQGACVCGAEPACEGTAASLCCEQGCTDTLTDPANCGGCAIDCVADDSCLAGRCACPAGDAAGSVDLWTCGCVDPEASEYLCDDIRCEDASDCTSIDVGSCCRGHRVAVRADRAAALEAAVPPCDHPDVICPTCSELVPAVECVLGRCAFPRDECVGQAEAERIAVTTAHPEIEEPGAEQIARTIRAPACAGWWVFLCDLNPACECDPDYAAVVAVDCAGEGTLQATLLCAEGDSCAEPIVAEVGVEAVGDTTWTLDTHDASCLDGDTGHDVYFQYTAASPGYLAVEVAVDAEGRQRSLTVSSDCDSEVACHSVDEEGGASSGVCVLIGEVVHAVVSDETLDESGPVTLTSSITPCRVGQVCRDDVGCTAP